jgi:hypothetical protein
MAVLAVENDGGNVTKGIVMVGAFFFGFVYSIPRAGARFYPN